MTIIKMISRFNFYKGTIYRLNNGYIVIHYVGGLSSAKQNCQYSASGNNGKSAHFFIDHNGDIYQSVEVFNSAWHCGSKTGYKHPQCRNANSIGIELCCLTTGDKNKADANWYFEDATVLSAIELVRSLMTTYNIPADHVLRHYDVTGKICPAPYVFNTGKHTWEQFQAAIKGKDPVFSNSTSKVQNETTSLKNVDEIGWNSFVEAEYPEVVAAAFLGNIQAESALKPNNLQNSYEKTLGMNDETYTSAVDNGTYSKEKFYNDKAGYGLVQWTYWSRKKAMYEYIVEKLKKSIGDASAQFDFLLHELSTSYSGLVKKLKACTTVKEASDLILTQYEKPANQSDAVKDKRASYGQAFYDKFHGKSSQSSTQQSSTFINADVPFLVDIVTDDLNIRKGPGTNYEKTFKYTGKGRFTIVEVKDGKGSESGWGRLKSGAGWISLDYAIKV